MGLKFAPLGWIYHDGWDWNQTKTLLKPEGDRIVEIDASKHCHQRGHVHLFLPTVPFSQEGSSLAYWGEQTYHFEVKDEWGPNSDDPSQNQSVRLIGKPIWYVYVEEYWRRFYIQPWDIVDDTCKLPCNQETTYTQRGLEEYCHELIGNAKRGNSTVDLHKSHLTIYRDSTPVVLTEFDGKSLDGRWEDGSYWFDFESYLSPYHEHGDSSQIIGYDDYLAYRMRKAARQLFIRQDAYLTEFKRWIASTYFSGKAEFDESAGEIRITVNSGEIYQTIQSNSKLNGVFAADYATTGLLRLNPTISDKLIIEYLYSESTSTETFTETVAGQTVEQSVTTTIRRIDDFEEFYRMNASYYSSYVDTLEVVADFMAIQGLTLKNGCKISEDDTVLVPDDRTRGHVGIRFDASKPCHSLGPFMEGGEFYFFNTVVNRTMPCEYWLDDEMRTRQYYIKQKWSPTTGTNGGQTWTFDGDRTHFKWVPSMFSDAQKALGDDYNPDVAESSYYYYPVHRLPNLYSAENYNCKGMNAKRLKNDRIVNGTEHSDNDVVLHDKYQQSAQVKSTGKSSDSPKRVIYGENGIEIVDDTPASVTPHSVTHLKWENDGWTGWYEKNELVKCVTDGLWYRRTWSPIRYEPDSGLWNQHKRQSFPNPSPWLCDGTDGARYSTEPSQSGGMEGLKSVRSNWCTSKVYDNDEANRIHLLHWEYAMYFNLVRKYPQDFSGDEATLRKHYFMFSTPSTNPTSNVLFVKVQASGGSYAVPAATYQDDQPYIGESMVSDEHPFAETPADLETLMEEYAEQNGTITSIEEENAIFEDWLSSLGSAFFMRFEDRDIMWDRNGSQPREITQSDIRDGDKYVVRVVNGEEILAPLPDPEFTVSYSSMSDDDGGGYTTQTYLTFGEFRKAWTPLARQEIEYLKLNGDMPQRNDYKFRSADDAYPELDDPNSQLTSDEREFKRQALGTMESGRDDESAPSLLNSEFFPRVDTLVRAENKRRSDAQLSPLFTPSQLDEVGDGEGEGQEGTLAYVVRNGIPFDPCRGGTVNPIATWEKYFDHREEFTIPDGTTAGGDAGITNNYGSPNLPNIHPREMSYHHEDGARRHYPDDMFVSPAIEYQKIIRRDYGRMPGKDKEEEYLQRNWKTDKQGDWGDGFDITVTIPWKENGEIQSPFSEDDHVTRPIGEYCHNAVKPEDKMRYHLEFYDSLDQIRKYDFPNYINIIHAFQNECLPEGVAQGNYIQSYYKEDFNDYEKTEKMRDDAKDENLKLYNQQRQANGLSTYATWRKRLDEYWVKINGNDGAVKQNIYIDQPVVRGMDCHGNEVEENAFETLDDGSVIWREQTTNLLPDATRLEKVNGKTGYMDSKGNFVKGGGVVSFNDPYPEHSDGKWYEECLGAVCRARCVLILEDALGYRWQQVVEETALQPDQPIRGSDYDG